MTPKIDFAAFHSQLSGRRIYILLRVFFFFWCSFCEIVAAIDPKVSSLLH